MSPDSCVDGRFRYLYSVIGGYLRILDAPSVQSCCTLLISASYLFMADVKNPDLFVCCCCCLPFSPCSFQSESLASRWPSTRTASVGLLHKSDGIIVVG